MPLPCDFRLRGRKYGAGICAQQETDSQRAKEGRKRQGGGRAGGGSQRKGGKSGQRMRSRRRRRGRGDGKAVMLKLGIIFWESLMYLYTNGCTVIRVTTRKEDTKKEFTWHCASVEYWKPEEMIVVS